MNQPATYEQLIAAKLQELSAPAKIDAIWARIEQQLDVEMPTDEPGSSNTGGSSNPGFYFPGSKLLYVFLAAAAGIYFLARPYAIQNQASETNSNNHFKLTDTGKTIKNTGQLPGREIIFTDKADMPDSKKKDQSDAIIPAAADEAQPEITVQEPESMMMQPAVSLPITTDIKKQVPPVITTDSIPKKGRGVKGITTNDYKIAPVKKDNQP